MKSMAHSGGWHQPKAIEVVAEGLQFPEGPFWSSRDNCVYFVEDEGDKVCALQDGKVRTILEVQAGDGPTGLKQDQDGNLWLCMYSSRKLLQLRPSGEILQTTDNYKGDRFKGPNDLVIDAEGGIYFTDSGNSKDDWTTGRPAGAIYYLTSEGKLLQVDSKLCYPNGIALSLDGKSLVVNEHRKNRILKYSLNPNGTLSNRKVFFEMDSKCLLDESLRYELGPDGMCLDSQGNFWVAHYGGGKVVVLSPEGKLLGKVYLPQGRRPTNTAFDRDKKALYVTEGELGLLYRIYFEKGLV